MHMISSNFRDVLFTCRVLLLFRYRVFVFGISKLFGVLTSFNNLFHPMGLHIIRKKYTQETSLPALQKISSGVLCFYKIFVIVFFLHYSTKIIKLSPILKMILWYEMYSRNCYISQSNVINVKRLLQQFNQTIALSPTLFHDKNVLEKAKFWGNIFERTHLYLGLCGHNWTHRISEERRIFFTSNFARRLFMFRIKVVVFHCYMVLGIGSYNLFARRTYPANG